MSHVSSSRLFSNLHIISGIATYKQSKAKQSKAKQSKAKQSIPTTLKERNYNHE
jgi:hypothetical protein